ncbi:R3H domain-containing nucleic acid-binding protein [Synechococcus sp. R70.1]|uniref:R3H domain-containing nucleic acid-binding protein n=1 Tax=Synechococcus sp. R70.1 TaxID=2964531 RepID=UPI0039C1EE7A
MSFPAQPLNREPTSFPGQVLYNDDLNKLLDVLPPAIRERLQQHPHLNQLMEVVLDLGRRPEARFPGFAEYLSEEVVSRADLDLVISQVGEFSSDNRAGIASTLHRISAIRNRQGTIIGLTCRVGRCVVGVITMIRDLVEQGRSMLLLGRPGVGKTTALREIARVLADELHKRVIIIDTSNEIAGDGDVPHPGIGRARRMQVASPELQHKVMIEAVENHMPEVVIIDEIGTELEALASRTIAERGVQLVATAHGNRIENLIKNPTLSDLIGGIQSVTLGDEEARRRGCQKSVLERKAPPTFEIAVEMLERHRWVIHEDVAATVDCLLRNREASIQIRSLDERGQVVIVRSTTGMNGRSSLSRPQWPPADTALFAGGGTWGSSGRLEPLPLEPVATRLQQPGLSLAREEEPTSSAGSLASPRSESKAEEEKEAELPQDPEGLLRIYPYGVSRFHLEQVIQTLQLPAQVTKDLDEADIVLALRSQVRSRSKIQQLAHSRQIPIHTVKANTLIALAGALRRILNIESEEGAQSDLELFIQASTAEEAEALEEARLAVEQIVIPKSQPVELLPRSAHIRKLQHQLVESYHLRAQSFGEEPNRRLRIYPN